MAGLLRLAVVPSAHAADPPIKSVPYSWHNVAIGGGGFVTGIIFHPRAKNLLYTRTDVGGAYRWDVSAGRWVPMTDWIGMEDANLTGIESLALNPSDPNDVYLAAGTYSQNRAAILRSTNRGATFERINVPFTMGGNESGRFNGERLAVDPNLGSILFFGSRRDGLWRSADRGATWHRVESFPGGGETANSSESRPRGRGFGFQQAVGIVCILFDPDSGKPGAPTSTIYAEVSERSTNVFRSTDAGATWQPVPDQPGGFCPNHIVRAPDGILYLSYGREPGPNAMTDGAVWKLDPKGDRWTDITPEQPATSDQTFGYGAVAVDDEHPATIMVTTFCHWHPHDEIFRSTNSGATWTQLWRTNYTEWDYSSAPYTATRSPHWMGALAINPFNSDQVIFGTGYGIWSCVNATADDHGRPTRWVFLDQGIEETVPLALISPPEGAHLLTGLGDIDGFRHDDLDMSPADGTFAGPRFSNTEGLAFAAKNPLTIVRIGSGREDTHAAISVDGGKTWSGFETDPIGGNQGNGTLAISADGRIIVWTPRRGRAQVTVDRGAHWKECQGLAVGAAVIADPIDAKAFYAWNSRESTLFASADGAVAFAAAQSMTPGDDSRDGSAGSGNADAVLCAMPGRGGDLWLASHAEGLWHSPKPGAPFTRVRNVRAADSLGFGKAAPGNDSPALYLIGAVGAGHAIYRSDDDGATWVRINDDQHQYGWISHITGDPRIFGRVYFGTGGRGVIYGDPAP